MSPSLFLRCFLGPTSTPPPICTRFSVEICCTGKWGMDKRVWDTHNGSLHKSSSSAPRDPSPGIKLLRITVRRQQKQFTFCNLSRGLSEGSCPARKGLAAVTLPCQGGHRAAPALSPGPPADTVLLRWLLGVWCQMGALQKAAPGTSWSTQGMKTPFSSFIDLTVIFRPAQMGQFLWGHTCLEQRPLSMCAAGSPAGPQKADTVPAPLTLLLSSLTAKIHGACKDKTVCSFQPLGDLLWHKQATEEKSCLQSCCTHARAKALPLPGTSAVRFGKPNKKQHYKLSYMGSWRDEHGGMFASHLLS